MKTYFRTLNMIIFFIEQMQGICQESHLMVHENSGWCAPYTFILETEGASNA